MANKFLVNGKEFDPQPAAWRQKEIKQFLDKCSTDEVFDREELAKRSGITNEKTISEFHKNNPQYMHRLGVKYYYGHPKAVEKFKGVIEAHRKVEIVKEKR